MVVENMPKDLTRLFLKLRKIYVPQVLGGAKDMIKLLSEEDSKINDLNKKPAYVQSPIHSPKTVQELVNSYAGMGINKDYTYLFIK